MRAERGRWRLLHCRSMTCKPTQKHPLRLQWYMGQSGKPSDDAQAMRFAVSRQIATIYALPKEILATGVIHFLLNANPASPIFTRRSIMKKFILAIAASSLIATPVLAAPGQAQHNAAHQERSTHSQSIQGKP